MTKNKILSLVLLVLLPVSVILAASLLINRDSNEAEIQQLSSTTSTVPEVSTTIGNVTVTLPKDLQIELTQRIIEFEQAYFARNLKDDVSSYSLRIKPYASQSFMDWMDFEVVIKEPYLSLRADDISVEAVIDKSDVIITFDEENTNNAWVKVNPTIMQKRNDEIISSIDSVVHFTLWRYELGLWKVYPGTPR